MCVASLISANNDDSPNCESLVAALCSIFVNKLFLSQCKVEMLSQIFDGFMVKYYWSKLLRSLRSMTRNHSQCLIIL